MAMLILPGSKPTTAPLRRIIWKLLHWLPALLVAEAAVVSGRIVWGMDSAICVLCMNAPEAIKTHVYTRAERIRGRRWTANSGCCSRLKDAFWRGSTTTSCGLLFVEH